MENMFTVTYGGQIKKYSQITPSAGWSFLIFNKFVKLLEFCIVILKIWVFWSLETFHRNFGTFEFL
jgi:hypothetical protein